MTGLRLLALAGACLGYARRLREDLARGNVLLPTSRDNPLKRLVLDKAIQGYQSLFL